MYDRGVIVKVVPSLKHVSCIVLNATAAVSLHGFVVLLAYWASWVGENRARGVDIRVGRSCGEVAGRVVATLWVAQVVLYQPSLQYSRYFCEWWKDRLPSSVLPIRPLRSGQSWDGARCATIADVSDRHTHVNTHTQCMCTQEEWEHADVGMNVIIRAEREMKGTEHFSNSIARQDGGRETIVRGIEAWQRRGPRGKHRSRWLMFKIVRSVGKLNEKKKKKENIWWK